MNRLVLFLTIALPSCAEVHTLTLKQAVALALQQNPDLVIARLDEHKAIQSIRIARDAFAPKVYGGSGLAWSSGYPNSIDGSAPSIFQARTDMAIYNRAQSLQVAEARENARGAQIDVQARLDEIAFRTASLFLDAEQSARGRALVEKQIAGFETVAASMRDRVAEGRELPIEVKRAALGLAKARQRTEALRADQDYAESSLAVVLGYPPADRARASGDERTPLDLPASEEALTELALNNSKEVRRLESAILARGLEARAQRATRIPKFDLVAQYSLFAKRNYQDFFPKVQRNNAQLGVSITVPILLGSAAAAAAVQADDDVRKLQVQMNSVRNRISLDAKKGFDDLKRTETASEVAKLDLEVAREDLSLLLAQFGEGRLLMSKVEQARLIENEKWIGFYDVQLNVERARLNLVRQAGTIVTALR